MKPSIAYTKRCCGPEGCGEIRDDGRRYCIAFACMAWDTDSEIPFKALDQQKLSERANLGDCGLKK